MNLAFDGIEGLEKAYEMQPGLIILDFEMPQMNGVEVARAIKSNLRTRDIPIILFTQHDLEDAVKAGMEGSFVELIPNDQ